DAPTIATIRRRRSAVSVGTEIAIDSLITLILRSPPSTLRFGLLLPIRHSVSDRASSLKSRRDSGRENLRRRRPTEILRAHSVLLQGLQHRLAQAVSKIRTVDMIQHQSGRQ